MASRILSYVEEEVLNYKKEHAAELHALGGMESAWILIRETTQVVLSVMFDRVEIFNHLKVIAALCIAWLEVEYTEV